MMALFLASSLALPLAPRNATAIPVRAPPTSDKRFTSACAYLEPYLDTSMCTCADTSTLGAQIECDVNVIDLDTIGVKADVEPCSEPMHMDMEVTEADMGIDFPIADITAGVAQQIPVPGRTRLAARTCPDAACPFVITLTCLSLAFCAQSSGASPASATLAPTWCAATSIARDVRGSGERGEHHIACHSRSTQSDTSMSHLARCSPAGHHP